MEEEEEAGASEALRFYPTMTQVIHSENFRAHCNYLI
jgi:hypothetical protein